MLIDSHCHLDRIDLTPYNGDFTRMLNKTFESNITRMLCVAINLKDYPRLLKLIDPFPQIDLSVGIHPNENFSLDSNEPTIENLYQLTQNPRVVAIGETGLDFYRNQDNFTQQHERFRTQIAAARITKKPLIIHTRNAGIETLKILKLEKAQEIGGVFHCFTETWEIARAALNLGFYLSFSGILTFRNASELRKIAQRAPLDRILIETDAPYLAPDPHRGKSNEPRFVKLVATTLAQIRQLELDEIAYQTTANYLRLFCPSENVALTA